MRAEADGILRPWLQERFLRVQFNAYWLSINQSHRCGSNTLYIYIVFLLKLLNSNILKCPTVSLANTQAMEAE